MLPLQLMIALLSIARQAVLNPVKTKASQVIGSSLLKLER